MNQNPTWKLNVRALAAVAVVGTGFSGIGLGQAHALPPLPAADLADHAVRRALGQPLPSGATSQPFAGQTSTGQTSTSQPAAKSDVVLGRGAPVGRSAVLKSTAYNSLAAQTDSTPFITATGTRTRVGVVALSRDMLRLFPYGTRLRIEDLSGNHPYVNGRTFIVEDTMHPRKTNQIDVWMPGRSQALQWGVRRVRVTVVR